MTQAPGRGQRRSVVIPSYNHRRLIPEALAAIARQTVPPFEVVVVDDGSTDDSLARLQSLAAVPSTGIVFSDPAELAPLFGRGLRRRPRAIRTQSRRRHWHVQ